MSVLRAADFETIIFSRRTFCAVYWLSTRDAAGGPAHEATFNKYYKELDPEMKKVRGDNTTSYSKVSDAISRRNMQPKAAGWYVFRYGVRT